MASHQRPTAPAKLSQLFQALQRVSLAAPTKRTFACTPGTCHKCTISFPSTSCHVPELTPRLIWKQIIPFMHFFFSIQILHLPPTFLGVNFFFFDDFIPITCQPVFKDQFWARGTYGFLFFPLPTPRLWFFLSSFFLCMEQFDMGMSTR